MRRAGRFWGLLALLLLAGSGLRLYHLSPEEFVEGDDATYYLTARSLALLGEWGWDNWEALVQGSADPQGLQARFAAEGVEVRFPYYSKPFFDFLNLAALALLGPTPDSLLWMNVFFGGAAIVLIGVLGHRLYGEAVGLLAAALLAVSGSALIFSRSGMAHISSIALGLAALVCYGCGRRGTRSEKWALAGAGIGGGLALATHPNLLPFAGLLLAFEGVYSYRRGSLAMAAQRLGFLLGGLLAVLAGIQLFYLGAEHLLAGVLAGLPPAPAPLMTYLEQLTAHTQAVIDGQVALQEKLYTYILVFWAHEGGLVWLLILGGSLAGLASWRRGEAGALVLLALFWVPLIFFILSRNQAVYRYAAGLVVPALLIAAWALIRACSWLGARRGMAPGGWWWAAGLVLVGYNLAQLGPVYRTQSAWAAGGRWLREQGQTGVMSSAGVQLWAFSHIAAAPGGTASPPHRYWALYRRYPKPSEQPLLQALEAQHLAPVFRAEHRRPTKQLEVQFIGESPLLGALAAAPGFGGRIRSMRAEVLRRNQLCFLEIYDLNQVGPESPVSQLPEQGRGQLSIMTRSDGYAEHF